MKLLHEASAGTTESGDAKITVRPGTNGNTETVLDVSGPSVARYGQEIRSVAAEVLTALGVTGAVVTIEEKGALDATIRARLTAACGRAADQSAVPWEAL